MALGIALRNVASACMDVSDGLVQDLAHLCNASQLRSIIESARVPRSKNVSLETALTGGDDYELLFTVPAMTEKMLTEISARIGVALTRIGYMEAGSGVAVLDESGAPMSFAQTGYRHFRAG